MAWAIFGLLSFLCVASVAAMILSRNQAHNALFLVLCFACLGGLFGLLDAPFVAAVQVIVYAGAIMVLFLFVIMMIDSAHAFPPERKRLVIPAALLLALVLFVELAAAGRKALSAPVQGSAAGAGDPAGLGRLLFSSYLYPFEITSLLLLAALIGALTLAGKKEDA